MRINNKQILCLFTIQQLELQVHGIMKPGFNQVMYKKINGSLTDSKRAGNLTHV